MKLLRTQLARAALVVGGLAVPVPGAQAQFSLADLGTNHQGALVSGALPGFFNLTGGGADIWEQWDGGAFAFQTVSGDFDVQVRGESLQPKSQWSRAGLMIRETLSESSRMCFNRVTPPAVLCADGQIGANDSRFAY